MRVSVAPATPAPTGTTWSNTIQLMRKREQKRWFIIDPRTNRHMGKWDFLSAVALVYTAIGTPYEISFLSAPTWASRASAL